MKKMFLAVAVALTLSGFLDDDAHAASRNLSKATDNFEINRRVVFYNGITSEYVLSVEGRCSIRADGADRHLEVTCKTGENEFKTHFLGLSDNVTYFAEQLQPVSVSTYHYRVIFKPQSILPDVDFKGSVDALGDLAK